MRLFSLLSLHRKALFRCVAIFYFLPLLYACGGGSGNSSPNNSSSSSSSGLSSSVDSSPSSTSSISSIVPSSSSSNSSIAVTQCQNGQLGTPAAADIPDNFNASFLTQAIDFSNAKTLCHDAAPIPQGQQQTPSAVAFSEVGVSAGLRNAVGGGNQHGVGIGFIDVDGDGWFDIFIANGLQEEGGDQYNSMLYRNNRDGTFSDVTNSSGVSAILDNKDTFSVAAADYDADGDVDIAIGTHPKDVLMSNDGNGNFSDVSQAVGLNNAPASSSQNARFGISKILAFGDYNSDGWMDIVSASAAFNSNDKNIYLLRNNQGMFTDVTQASGVTAANEAVSTFNAGNPCAVMWSDYDNDGQQDIMIWSDRGDSFYNRVLLKNNGDNTFDEVSRAAGIAGRGVNGDVGNPMGIDAADVDHDGDLDFYVSTIGGGNPLMLNDGDGTFTIDRDAAPGEFGWGLAFEDFNADGWADIFVTQEDDLDYLVFTHPGVVPVDYGDPLRLTHTVNSNFRAHNVAAAFADYDRDGKVDAVTATTDGSRIQLWKNTTDYGSNRWLEVKVSNTPMTGENGGITARVVVKTGDLVQFRDITGGASRASQNGLSVRFGLGQWSGAEWVAAIWPDGRQVTILGVPGNQTLDLTQ